MKTLQITGYGKIKSNLAFAEINIPKVGNNDILIEIHAASVNPIDYKIVEGALKRAIKLTFPAPIGYDVSGIVIKKGEDVTDFELNDEVFARVPREKNGTFAEYIAVDSSVVAKKPDNLNFVEAASIPLVGLTTVQVFEKANIKSGDKVLIHAGSGGIGTFAIQYAKSKGAYVYTTTSTKNVDWIKNLGADKVIDYKKENYLDIVKDIDIVYDTLGKNYTIDAFKVIKSGGKVISIIGELDDETAKELELNSFIRFLLSLKRIKITQQMKKKSATYKFVLMKPNASQLDDITILIEKQLLKPIIDKVFDLDKAMDALLYLKEGRAKGKVVIKMK